MLGDSLHDIRLALRLLTRRPGFSATVIGILAIAIGVNSAVFAVAYGVLLRPLPYPAARSILVIQPVSSQVRLSTVSPRDFQQLQVAAGPQLELAVARPSGRTVVIRSSLGSITASLSAVGSGLLPLLRLRPEIGHNFQSDSTSAEVLLSDRIWRSAFLGNPSIVGMPMQVDNHVAIVAGVLPPEFGSAHEFGDPGGAWELANTGVAGPAASRSNLVVFARLRPGVTLTGANAQLSAIGDEIARQNHHAFIGWTLHATGLEDSLAHGWYRGAILALFVAVCLLTLIACANASCLLLARAFGRAREFGARVALGASFGAIARQLTVEVLVLASLAAASGLGLASLLIRLAHALPNAAPRMAQTAIDGWVIAYAAGISLLCGMIASLPSVRLLARQQPWESLNGAGGTAAGGLRLRGASRISAGLLAADISLSCLLLFGCGVLASNLLHVLETPTGMNTRNVLAFDVGFTPPQRANAPANLDVVRRLLDVIRALPGVEAAAVSDSVPMDQGVSAVMAGPAGASGPQPALLKRVGAGYFALLHVRLLRGRAWPAAALSAPPAVVVNQLFAQEAFGSIDCLGRSINFRLAGKTNSVAIVGVVANTVDLGLDQAPLAAIYMPYWQAPSFASILVRSGSRPAAALTQVLNAARHTVPSVPMLNGRVLDNVVYATAAPVKTRTELAAILGFAALIFAAVGIFGTVQHAVGRRRRELAIRVAIGAAPGDLVGMLIGEVALLAGIGIALAIPLAALGARALQSNGLIGAGAPGSSGFEVWALCGAAVLVSLVAVGASLIPALHASHRDPLASLRPE